MMLHVFAVQYYMKLFNNYSLLQIHLNQTLFLVSGLGYEGALLHSQVNKFGK